MSAALRQPRRAVLACAAWGPLSKAGSAAAHSGLHAHVPRPGCGRQQSVQGAGAPVQHGGPHLIACAQNAVEHGLQRCRWHQRAVPLSRKAEVACAQLPCRLARILKRAADALARVAAAEQAPPALRSMPRINPQMLTMVAADGNWRVQSLQVHQQGSAQGRPPVSMQCSAMPAAQASAALPSYSLCSRISGAMYLRSRPLSAPTSVRLTSSRGSRLACHMTGLSQARCWQCCARA